MCFDIMSASQWDHVFADGAMFQHGNIGQGIYADPGRDFCGMYFGLASNIESTSVIYHSPEPKREREPDRNFVVIIKDGKIGKNAVRQLRRSVR